MIKYFRTSFIVLILGIIAAMGFVYSQSGSTETAMQAGFTALLLAILEISLSFDNAVVNATILKKMTPIWERRFLTWGILIAVFGMRLLFPVLIVALVAHIGPIEAFKLSLQNADRYSEIMTSAHTTVAAFGGMFLFMVFIHFFMNEDKIDHWIKLVEKPLVRMSEFKGTEIVIPLVFLIMLTQNISGSDQMTFLYSGLWGMVVFLIVHGLSEWLENMDIAGGSNRLVASGGLGLFLYLEVLDASFSFDGVIGAFALTNSLILIMIGLGIGAFFVRSLTIYFVDHDTLGNFKYLEHGAFYALGALAFLMLFDPFIHIPEWVTGLVGALILIASVVHSRYCKDEI